MLRKNFPGRKKLHQESAARRAKPLTNAEQVINYRAVCERAKAYNAWYLNLHSAKRLPQV